MNFVALDFETANSGRGSVCAVGIACVSGGQVVERKTWLVRPSELRFDRINVSIHGITADDVRDKPQFNVLWPTLAEYLTGQCIVAHNASFDMSVLRYVLREYGLEFPDVHYHCSIIVAKRTWSGLNSYRLNNVADHLGITFRHHDAEEDAVAAAEIMIKAASVHSASCMDELCNKTATTQGHLYAGGWVPPRSKRMI